MASPNLSLVGLHFHLGSPVSETTPYEMAMEIVLHFAREMKRRYNFLLEELSIGGGFAVPYTAGVTAMSISGYAANIAGKLNSLIAETGLARPELIIVPGRSLVAQAGVALYQVGTIKEIPGVRKYVALDGGMSDNIRPALYGAKYEALVANKALGDAKEETVTLVGKMCESGDIIIRDISLPQLVPGDIIAVPVCGAYSVPMWNNYNASLKPAIIMLKEGNARLIQRRENYHDLLNLDTI
jgi:diaminopimelate decarboxylase